MALFSFRHSVKTFSPKCESADRVAKDGQTAAHLQYITRPSAAREVVRARMEHATDTAQATAAERVAKQRKGRVCERFIIALPFEATDAERLALARRFSDELTQGRAGYILAIHDKAGNDSSNPHFHLVAFDVHEATGGRGRPRSVIGMARKNAVQSWAKRWAEIHNEMMCGWGYGPESTISNLSYADRGIDRIAEIHEGPASRKMKERGVNLVSKPEWKQIDAGCPRAEANDLIREINQMNKEIKNDEHNRLGSRNAGNPGEGNGSRPPFGEDRRRLLPDTTRLDPAGKDKRGQYQGTERDRQPPWLAAGRTERPDDLPAQSARRTLKWPSSGPTMRPDWPPIRRTRVRRVFLELIFLRDTLRARLATLSGRSQPLPGSKVAELFWNRATQDTQTRKDQQR